ncbi:copper resistance protein CopD [Sphingomonas sp. Leaf24]|jgi:putative copper resistance protein D|uniref:copper homeostasis membrane protein CopD n=1 Tax=unclassified Sphingomonas TaxID=196159 RepID=UPI0006FE7DC3|nr:MULTISPECIES: copper homeostasis membrane protein CopD [unclassified Sphingomonas]KQM20143.1 copper resistance protein CopD [Sphingomonas sp. Leaf5]KQM90945.1 copper resistance protein CopD [Sphingomonas sp. Leaf24]KQM94181.1 copper resistance protein CopD [Sphingomonas sp. Leaf22]
MIGVRFALYGVLGGLFGLSAFSLYGLRAGERVSALALRPWLVAGAVLGLLLSAVALALLAAAMMGTPPWPVDRDAIGMLLDQPGIGTAWKLRVAALAVAALAALFTARRGLWLVVVALASGASLATLAWTGHGAMNEGTVGWVHLAADILHLVAAGAWTGALLGLVLLVARPARRVDATHLALSYRALHGFGTVGTIVVTTLVVTGLINAWLLVGPGNVRALGTTLYGQLLLAKLALFALMLGLAALNRFRLMPRFEASIAASDHRGALGALRRSLGAETGCIIAILALVAWLGTLEPLAP